jgi:hypothetical protein
VLAVGFGDALAPDFFREEDWTDWFGQGFRHAYENDMLG